MIISMSSALARFIGVTWGDVGTDSWPCSIDAVTSSVVTVGSDLMDMLSRLVGELLEMRRFTDFLR